MALLYVVLFVLLVIFVYIYYHSLLLFVTRIELCITLTYMAQLECLSLYFVVCSANLLHLCQCSEQSASAKRNVSLDKGYANQVRFSLFVHY